MKQDDICHKGGASSAIRIVSLFCLFKTIKNHSLTAKTCLYE